MPTFATRAGANAYRKKDSDVLCGRSSCRHRRGEHYPKRVVTMHGEWWDAACDRCACRQFREKECDERGLPLERGGEF